MTFNGLDALVAGGTATHSQVRTGIMDEIEALRGASLVYHPTANTATAINTAITDVNAAGGGMVLVSGDVEMTDYIRMRSNVTLMGNPYKRARLRFADAYQPATTGRMFGTFASGQTSIRVSNIDILPNTVQMAWALTQTSGWQGISQLFRLDNATNVEVDHCHVTNTAVRYAIYLQACSGHIHIHHNDVASGVYNVAGAQQMDGIHLMNPNCTSADPCIIEWNRVYTGEFGGDDGIVIRNIFGGGTTANIIIRANDVYASGETPIRLVAEQDTTTTNVSIVGNRIHCASRGGIHLSRATRTGGVADPVWTVTIDRNAIHGWGLDDAANGAIYRFTNTGVTLGDNPVMTSTLAT